MFRAFNMGVGLVIVCSSSDGTLVLDTLTKGGEAGAFRLGTVVAGDRTVQYV